MDKKRTASIYCNNELVGNIEFDYYESQSIEQCFFFAKDKKVTAIVPYKYLVIIND